MFDIFFVMQFIFDEKL